MGGILIKLILILLLLVLYQVYRSGSAGRRAMGRFMPLIALALAAIAVIFPDLTQDLARLVGVTYGANLIVYLSIMGLLLMVVAMRGALTKQARDITLLARKIAIDEARPASHKKTESNQA
ncbi:DUF2304 domain-containing protein [bacterium]|nr:DUF2304 domain-containing protein [bacterium]